MWVKLPFLAQPASWLHGHDEISWFSIYKTGETTPSSSWSATSPPHIQIWIRRSLDVFSQSYFLMPFSLPLPFKMQCIWSIRSVSVSYPVHKPFHHIDIQCQQRAPRTTAAQIIIKKYSFDVNWFLLLTNNMADLYKLYFISQEEVLTETRGEDYHFKSKQLQRICR